MSLPSTGDPGKDKHTVRYLSAMPNRTVQGGDMLVQDLNGSWWRSLYRLCQSTLHILRWSVLIVADCVVLHLRATRWQDWAMLQVWPTAHRASGRRGPKVIPPFRVSGHKEGRYQFYYFHGGSPYYITHVQGRSPQLKPRQLFPWQQKKISLDNSFKAKAHWRWGFTFLYSLQVCSQDAPRAGE